MRLLGGGGGERKGRKGAMARGEAEWPKTPPKVKKSHFSFHNLSKMPSWLEEVSRGGGDAPSWSSGLGGRGKEGRRGETSEREKGVETAAVTLNKRWLWIVRVNFLQLIALAGFSKCCDNNSKGDYPASSR